MTVYVVYKYKNDLNFTSLSNEIIGIFTSYTESAKVALKLNGRCEATHAFDTAKAFFHSEQTQKIDSILRHLTSEEKELLEMHFTKDNS